MEWISKRRLGLVVLVFIGTVILWGSSHLEMYCSIFPSIDTSFSPSYTEEGFSKCQQGMTVDNVRKLIGDPLDIIHNKDGSETWWYSRDGKCDFLEPFSGDFAWLARSITVKDGKVVAIEKRIYYD